MRMRWLVTVAVVLSAALPVVASAIDAPHDSSFSDGACNRCHSLYISQSSAGVNNYNAGCLACHDASHNVSFGFPWLTEHQAKPGTDGNHHSWEGFAENAALDTHSPGSITLNKTLLDGKIQCISCHVPHDAGAALAPNSKHTSMPVGGVTGTPRTTGTGSANMILVSEGTAPRAYRLKISADRTSFVISHDFGLGTARTWVNWSTGTSAWVTGGTETGTGRPFTVGNAVALDDAAVTVKWTALPNAGDEWDFYVSYPFLRAPGISDSLCIACHKDRAQSHARVTGEDAGYLPDGVRRFSHPIGEVFGATERSAILDVNGLAQGVSGETNDTNNLVLDAGAVRCTTCHAVHNADSNSLTTDAR
jgi:hypothetical protein